MANLYQFAVTSVSNLASVIKAFRSTVVLGGESAVAVPGSGFLSNLVNKAVGHALVGGVTIYVQTYREIADSDVSIQLLMAKEGDKKWVADNVAPKPRSWQISGYITAIGAVEPSALLGYTLLAKKKQLMAMRNSREVINCKTMDNELVRVTIPELAFEHAGEVLNGIPVTMRLQEMVVVSVESSNGVQDPALPPSGTASGGETDIGSGTSTTLSDTSTTTILSFFGIQ